jgi:hypothetical protein
MRSNPAPIMPIFRTELQAQVLASLYLRQQETWTAASLAREFSVAPSTLHAEVQRLEEAELIAASQVGRARVLRANLAHPMSRPLLEILEYVYGPRAIISAEFRDIPGISRLLIFGSWAARHEGAPGPLPRDVDVLVVGAAERAAVYAAADRAQQLIGMPVNPVLASGRRWEAEADALIRQVKSGPVIDLTDEVRRDRPRAATA